MPSARRVRWAKVRIGALSVAGGAILGTLIVLLTGGTVFERKAQLYLFIPDATGLSKGSPVRVDGIGVGKVERVDLTGSADPKRVVRVTMVVDRDRLPLLAVDCSAQISAETLVGDKFVDIGSGRSPLHIQPGGEIAYQGQTDLLKNLDLSQFGDQIRIMDAVLTDIEQGRNRVGQFVVGEKIYADMRKKLMDLQRGLRAATDATSAVGGAIYSDRLYRRISEPLIRLDEALARVQAGQGTAGALVRDGAAYENPRTALADLRRALESVRNSEMARSDAAWASWNGMLSSLIHSVDQLNSGQSMTSASAYENLNGAAEELRGALRDFRRNPKAFLRLAY